MSTEGAGGSVVPVVLVLLAIGGLLLGASVVPSLGDHSPGANVTSPDVSGQEHFDEEMNLDDGPPPSKDFDEELAGEGGAGAEGAVDVDGETAIPDALLALGELIGPLGGFGDGGGGAEETVDELAENEDPAVEEFDDQEGDESVDEDSPESVENGDDPFANDDDSGDSDEETPENGDDEFEDAETDDEFEETESDDEDTETDGEETAADDEDEGLFGGLSDIGPYLLGGIALVALLLYLWWTDADVLTAIRELPAKVLSFAIATLIAFSNALERAVAALRRVESVVALPGLVIAAVRDWFGSARQRVRSVSLSSLRGGTSGEAEDDTTAATESGPSSARAQIYAAWGTVLAATPVRRYRTRAPGEIARDAVGAGLPDAPVHTITEAFRDVEYGGRDPAERVEQARRASEDIEATVRDGEDE